MNDHIDIEKSFASDATILDGWIGYNIHRATALACRMTRLIRLIPPAGATTPWREFDEIQNSWLEHICNVPRLDAERRQARLLRSLTVLGLYASEDIFSFSYVGSHFQYVDVRAIDRKQAPLIYATHAEIKTLIDSLHTSIAAMPDDSLPTLDPLPLYRMPEFTQIILIQTVFLKMLLEVSRVA